MWEKSKRIIILVVGLPPFLVGVIAIWDWFGKVSPSIVAEIRYSPYASTPVEDPERLSLDTYRGIWFANVSNTGELSAQNVSLQIPGAAFARIQRVDQEAQDKSIREIVEIGELRSRESLSIIIWSTSTASESYATDIVLRHKDGVGEVKIFNPVGPRWYWLSRNLWFVILMLMLLIWVSTSTYSEIRKLRSKPA